MNQLQRNASDSTRKLCKDMMAELKTMERGCANCSPFMRGDRDAVEPKGDDRIHVMTNPERNGAVDHIKSLFGNFQVIEPENVPWLDVFAMLDETYKYLDDLTEMSPEREFEASRIEVRRTENLLRSWMRGDIDTERFRVEVKPHCWNWRRSFEENALACFDCHYDQVKKRKVSDDEIMKRFPGFHPGKYILGVLDGCDRDRGYVTVHQRGNFYMPYGGFERWKILKIFIEAKSDDGYVDMKPYRNWQNLFQSSNSPKAPKDSDMDFVGGPLEFFPYIHGIDRTSLFRIESTPRRRF